MIGLLLAGMLQLPFLPKPQVEHKLYALNHWQIATARDRFTGEFRCSFRRDRVSVADGVATFRFPESADTGDAVYRLDSGPPISVHGELATLDARNRDLDKAPLDNPSEGRVVLPMAKLKGVNLVEIRLNVRHAPTKFRLNGLAEAISRSTVLGCRAD